MINWISGNVPGGFPLLFFILVSLNLALYYLYKYSQLFSKTVYLQKMKQVNGAILSTYIILWIALRPPTPPKSLLFLPFQAGDTVSSAHSEALQQYIGCKAMKGHFLFPWEEYYRTANKDSFKTPAYRLSLAQRMGVDLILCGSLKARNLELTLYAAGRQKWIKSAALENGSFREVAGFVLKVLREEIVFENPNTLCDIQLQPADIINLAQARQALAEGHFLRAIQWASEENADFDVIRADVLLQQGTELLKQKKEENKQRNASLLLVEDNLFYSGARQLLKQYQQRQEDTSEMNRILGEMYLYEQKYEYAEYFLKKALMQNSCNARVFYLLSFLHASRLEDMGFNDRVSLLEKAVQFNPGFAEAVLDLANACYGSGTASPVHSATIQARHLLERYLSFAPADIPALGLLAKITLQSEEYQKAIALYHHMADLGADKAEINYNLGICYYGLNDHQQAVQYFNQAIALSDYRDAYLYLGMIYKNRNDFDKALFYFRERIKRKSGDDDNYAREAMLGVRIILDKIAKAEETAKAKVNEK
jgi:tetratricopeptide (TPR) repeat protein